MIGQEGEPGQPGEPGIGGGGAGGRGGRGGRGGGGGDYRDDDRRAAIRHYTVVLLIGLLILGLYYTGQFDQRNNDIRACQLRNSQIREVNKRAEPINLLLAIAADDPANRNELALLRRAGVEQVPLTHCDEEFDRPWPF